MSSGWRLVSEFYEPGPNELVIPRLPDDWEERWFQMCPPPAGVSVDDMKALSKQVHNHVEETRRNARRDPDDCWGGLAWEDWR